MKLFFLFFYFFWAFINVINAATTLTTPDKLNIEQMNKEEKRKLQNISYSETLAIPNQYKGKLKFTEGKEEIYFKDLRLYFGIGGRFSIVSDLKLESNLNENGAGVYFNKKNTWEIKDNFNFFASGGVYWRNGIRLELEYSQMTLETGNYGKSFDRYNGSDVNGTGIIFNQYLQTSGILNTITVGNVSYNTLNNNMVPLAELSVKTFMLNIIFEKTYVKSKIRPYLGFGGGIVIANMNTLVNEGADTVLGGQVMIGLSYPIANEQLAFYFGYRGLFAMEIEQMFTRIIGVDVVTINGVDHAFDGTTYWNPIFRKSRETYKIQTHNIELGVKFFF